RRVAAADAIDVRRRAGAAQEEFVSALRGDRQPEVDEIVSRAVEVGTFKMRVEQRVRLHRRRAAARQFDASRTLPDIGGMGCDPKWCNQAVRRSDLFGLLSLAAAARCRARA